MIIVIVSSAAFDGQMGQVAYAASKRAGQPDEFARVVRDSVESIMLNGTVIRLDGAMRVPARL